MGRHSTKLDGDQPVQSPSPDRKRKREAASAPEIEVNISAPEPPSKKALRKAKKQKTEPSTEQEESLDVRSEKEGKEDGSEAIGPNKKSAFGIWIGNLSWSTSKEELRAFFTNNAELLDSSIVRLHMPAPSKAPIPSDRADKPKNKGFAYVNFDTKDAFAKAMTLSEKLFAGRKVLIKDAVNFEGRPKPAEKEQSGKPASSRIFVGNLSFDMTEDDLRQHFSSCGEISSVHLASFEDSGKCKGYGWIEFEDLKAAGDAVRGWVERREGDDSVEEEEQENQAPNEVGSNMKMKKRKLRKWWVNRLQGRELRMEFAEGKDVRYKKRFGKNGTAIDKDQKALSAEADSLEESVVGSTPRIQRERSTRDSRPRPDARSIKPGAALAAAPRLTGSIVKSQGKKITFT